jgi:hypothetical protein
MAAVFPPLMMILLLVLIFLLAKWEAGRKE